jgi:hypothetical protein
LLGLAYLIREFTPVFFGIAVVILLLYHQSRRRWLLVAGGAFAMFSVELIWNWVLYGNPLNRVLIFLTHGSSSSRFDADLPSVAGHPWREFLEFAGGLYWIVLAIALAVIPFLLFFLKKRPIGDGWVLLAWVVGMWLFMTAVGALPSLIAGEDYVVLRTHKLRYWYPILPALVVGGLGYMAALFPRRTWLQRLFGAIVLVLFVAIPIWRGISDLDRFSVFTSNGATHYEEVQEFLAKEGASADTIWALDDAWRATMRALPMLTQLFWGNADWEGETKSLNDGASFVPEESVDSGLYVFQPRAIASVLPHGDGDAPAFIDNPRPEWATQLVARNGELAVFDISKRVDPDYFYADDASGWQAVGISGWDVDDSQVKFEADRQVVSLENRERALIIDGQAEGFDSPDPQHLEPGYARGELEVASSVGGSIVGAVPAGVPNGHRVVVFCIIYLEDGTREQHLAVSGPFEKELDKTGFVCPYVGPSTPAVGARVAIRAVGGATLELGDVRMWWEPSSGS